MYRVIPDERPLIEQTLKDLCDVEGCSLVVTTGGTGPAPRDVTPEATEAVRSQGHHIVVPRVLCQACQLWLLPAHRPQNNRNAVAHYLASPPAGVRAHDAWVWRADACNQASLTSWITCCRSNPCGSLPPCSTCVARG